MDMIGMIVISDVEIWWRVVSGMSGVVEWMIP